MERFETSERKTLVSLEEIIQEARCKRYWEKFCQYLMKTNHETIPIGLIDRIDEKCSGFHDFVFQEYAVVNQRKMYIPRQLMHKKVILRKRNRKVIRAVVKSGIMTEEYKEYLRKNDAIRKQMEWVRRSEKRVWYVFLVLPNEQVVRLMY